MKKIEICVYKFDELSEDAKNNAIENWRDSDEIFLDFFTDNCVEKIKESGFTGNIKVQYSLNYCQGDGLSFQCDNISSEVVKNMFREVLGNNKEKTIETLYQHYEFRCEGNSGRYCFASKSDIDFYIHSYNYIQNIDEVVLKVREKLEEKYMDLCAELEKNGYEEIEYQRSDEAIKETLITNDYDFLENGEMY